MISQGTTFNESSSDVNDLNLVEETQIIWRDVEDYNQCTQNLRNSLKKQTQKDKN